MKAKDKNARSLPDKQKKQLMVLGGLVAVLGVVMVVQFGGKGSDAEAAAQTAEGGDPAATAQTLASDPAAAAAALGMPAPASSAPAPIVPVKVEDNTVLSEPVDDGLLRSPFASFWNVASGTTTKSGGVPEIAPPSITLNGTMPSPQHGLAIIDGEMHRVGDMIQGWELAEVLERRIVLRSPSQATVTVDMPLLTGASLTSQGR